MSPAEAPLGLKALVTMNEYGGIGVGTEKSAAIVNVPESVTVMPPGLINVVTLSLESKPAFIHRFFAVISTCPALPFPDERVRRLAPSRTMSPPDAKAVTLPVFPLL